MSSRILIDNLDDAELRPRPSRGWKRTIAAVVLGAVGLAAGCSLVAQRSHSHAPSMVQSTREQPPQVIGREEVVGGADFCKKYPYLKYRPNGVVNNNLEKKGPEYTKSEGIVLETVAVGGGAGDEFEQEVLIQVNAIGGDYVPFASRLNGLQGHYGSINLKSGSSVRLQFSFKDKADAESLGDKCPNLKMNQLALTFFDLDEGKNHKSSEYVEIGGFDSYHVKDSTEVKVSDGSHGRKRFQASTYGTGEDNPLDPMHLTPQQLNRAVTALFSDVEKVDVEIGAGAGMGPRFFTFVARPSLLCAATVQEGYKPPLDDLPYELPMQMPIKVAEKEKFKSWAGSTVGRKVAVGDVLFITDAADGEKSYKAPVAGTIHSIQSKLKVGEDLDTRLDDKTVCVIQRDYLAPLPTDTVGCVKGGPGHGDIDPHSHFVKYEKEVGETIAEGEVFATVKDHHQNEQSLKSKAYGVVKARQDLHTGDPIMTVKDANFITVDPYPALATGPNTMKAAVVEQDGVAFDEYKVQVGDIIKHGDTVGTGKDKDGNSVPIKASVGGIVTARQDIEPGTPMSRVGDHNLLTTGKFAPCPREEHQGAILFSKAVPEGSHQAGTSIEGMSDAEVQASQNHPALSQAEKEGLMFEKYHVQKGDTVEDGTLIATFKDKAGKKLEVRSHQPGVVKHLLDGLQEGMYVSKVMEDENMATIGRLPNLDVSRAERGAFAPNSGSLHFDEWKAHVGDVVSKGDTVAVLKKDNGETQVVKAARSGEVTERQEHLNPGDVVSEVTKDNDILTVGKLPPIEGDPIHRVLGVEAPSMDAIFDHYAVKEGDKVHGGDTIAVVRMPPAVSGGSRRLQGGSLINIPSPGTGTVTKLQPLEPGKRLGDQTLTPTIATVDMGPPWWLLLLGAMVALCCCFACLFQVMKKPAPVYKPMPPVETTPEPEPPAPEPVPEPKPEGLRLDFNDKGTIRTVYAKYRPLGIKHEFVAPIIVDDFTINAYAETELGVKAGWKLVRIDEEELNNNPNFDEVNDKITHHMKDFPLWPLPIEFRKNVDDTEKRVVKFVERPIGLEFTNLAPIQVGKVYEGSPADQKVEVGWFITKIGKADVHSSHDFREVMGNLKEGVQPLTDNGKKYT
uniref:Uncharacterized protein n=1 Tax=Alexandrium catenella TaxID=2925 RepID=A0A7S1Q2G1_ALECA|mmetsp:Transcript_15563/g.42399  ORF Transcript_15563/g.42399 Transcript_15563/m.42399 type:complete len:1124 (+) Transcript_15563:102-3473(+)